MLHSLAQEPQRLVAAALTRRLEAAARRVPGGDASHFQELTATTAVTLGILAELCELSTTAQLHQERLLISPVWLEGKPLTGWLDEVVHPRLSATRIQVHWLIFGLIASQMSVQWHWRKP